MRKRKRRRGEERNREGGVRKWKEVGEGKEERREVKKREEEVWDELTYKSVCVAEKQEGKGKGKGMRQREKKGELKRSRKREHDMIK